MFRRLLGLAFAACLAAPAAADSRVAVPIPLTLPARPTNLASALPYVKMLHDVLDVVSTRESPVVERAKLTQSEARSDWVVYRVRANVWVEKTSMNYLGQIGVRVSIPCHVEFSLDMAAVRHGAARYDPTRRLLVVELPPVQLREPTPILAEMRIEPHYKGLRGVLLDAEKVRRLQDELVKEDYIPAAREATMDVYDYAQRRARDQVQEFLQGLLRDAGADIEVLVR